VAKYRILIKPSAAKEIEAIASKQDRQRIVHRILSLENNPRPPGCEKLSGQDKYRVRQGRYRIVFIIEDKNLVIYVVKVGHRKDVYA
jgi:mRNA interferase RelE/StbE